MPQYQNCASTEQSLPRPWPQGCNRPDRIPTHTRHPCYALCRASSAIRRQPHYPGGTKCHRRAVHAAIGIPACLGGTRIAMHAKRMHAKRMYKATTVVCWASTWGTEDCCCSLWCPLLQSDTPCRHSYVTSLPAASRSKHGWHVPEEREVAIIYN